ncbi:MAG: hypothetical protein KAX49_16585 [Halanaerobiales bacterium]|nr:hypothetical protein [Halanaerobiales bacterium]
MKRDLFILIKGNGRKDLFQDRLLIEGGEFFYDSLSHGTPIFVSNNVLKNTNIPTSIPFQIYHNGKTVGEVRNIYWNKITNALHGDIQVFPDYNKEVLLELQKGNVGLSVRFTDKEREMKNYILIEGLKLEHCALVPTPASSRAWLA